MARTWDIARPRVWDHSRRRPTWAGSLRAWADTTAQRVRLAWAILATIWGWSDAQLRETGWILRWWPAACTADRGVLCAVSQAMRADAWPQAQAAVTRTSHTLGLNRKTAWVQLAHEVRDRREWAESMWRHLHAMRDLEAQTGGRLTNAERHLLIELAYVHHGQTGARQRGMSA